MEYNLFLIVLATLIALYSYIPYFRDIFAGKTKPHAFSWFIWGLLTSIAFVAQIVDKAGIGALITGFTALLSFLIFLAALKNKTNIILSDWLSLTGAGISLLVWYLTKNPLSSVIIITLIDALGFMPTFRKSFNKPNEETLQTYFLSGLKWILAIIVLEKYSVITVLYPLYLVIINSVFVVMVFIRRKQLK